MKKLLFVFLLLFSGASFAVSFDCKKFNTGVYKMICENPELSIMDDDLSKNYNYVNNFLKDRGLSGAQDEFKKIVTQLLKERDSCKKESCLFYWYGWSAKTYQLIILDLNDMQSNSVQPNVATKSLVTIDDFFNANPSLKNNTEIRIAILSEANSLARKEARSRGSKNTSSDAERAMRENGGEYAKQAAFEVFKDCHKEYFKSYDFQDSSCRTLEEWVKRNRP